MKTSDYIGFYSLYDEPCRIYEDEETGLICAERYYKGKGFVDILVSDVMWRGKQISEKAFKQLVLETMGRGAV